MIKRERVTAMENNFTTDAAFTEPLDEVKRFPAVTSHQVKSEHAANTLAE